MPLLSELIFNTDRPNPNEIKANVRYCDSQSSRHLSSYNTLCSYVSPLITALVPEEHKHKRMRNGIESTHYSFLSIQNASHLLRLNKRFESIDNDRREHVVDLLKYIASKVKDSESVMDAVVAQITSEGTICTLLKQICDAFKASLISESPQMEVVARNTTFIMDYTSKQLAETQKLNLELQSYRTNHLNLLEAVLEKNSNEKEKASTELCSVKSEIQVMNSAIERIDADFQMIGMDLKQELVEMKHETSLMREDIRSMRDDIGSMREDIGLMRDAIIDTLPDKLMQVFVQMQSSASHRSNLSHQSSELGSDLELIDSNNLEQLVRLSSEKNQLLSESSESQSSSD